MQRAVYFDSLSTVRSEKNVSTVFTDHTLESESCLKGRIFMDNHIFPFLWMRGKEESILRRELAQIRECGIKAVCLEARPHDDFCGPLWWRDMDIVLDEAQKYGMNVWILDDRHFPTGYANGGIEKHPERKKLYLACSTSDIFGKKGKHTLDISRMLKPSIGYWDIGKPVDYAERANNRLFAILALPFAGDDIFEEKVLDLTDSYDGERFADFELPGGQWRIHVLYTTRTDGGADNYINMIDKESAHTQIEGVYEAHYEKYGHLFGSVISGFFSDEPQFGNVTAYNFWDTQIGRCRMQLPWSAELEERLRAVYEPLGGLACWLPFLFTESDSRMMRTKIRQDYMDQVSLLYKQNFSDAVGDWCAAHGVEYIGHVVEDNGLHSRLGMGAAHYFRAMSGQHMAGIDDIGGQFFFGAANLHRKGMTDTDGEFFHHVLGRLGASAGHLDPKKKGRTMAELFGAYGWNFGVRDMQYLLEHFLTKGINYLVPHAFSMAEYPDPDCPPHYYAGGNNPEFPYFARLMKYAERMCGLLSGGQHVPSCAVLYDAEGDWNGDNLPMQKICRVLDEGEIDYLKWDFNRSIADVFSHTASHQGKVLHEYILGLYDFLERLCRRYPDMLIEGCAGGGGRFDAGMLYYAPQIWCSDNTDAIDRLRIQYGTSFGYPVSCVGAHVSTVPNEQNGRITPLKTRGIVAMSGTFGYELDPGKLTDEEKREIRQQIIERNRFAEIILNGKYYRLSDPFHDDVAAWLFVSRDKKEALLNIVNLEVHGNRPVTYVKLNGLQAGAMYRDDASEKEYPADVLMQTGMPVLIGLPSVPADREYQSIQILLRKQD